MNTAVITQAAVFSDKSGEMNMSVRMICRLMEADDRRLGVTPEQFQRTSLGVVQCNSRTVPAKCSWGLHVGLWKTNTGNPKRTQEVGTNTMME